MTSTITMSDAARARRGAYSDQWQMRSERMTALPAGVGARREMSNPGGGEATNLTRSLVERDGKQWFRTAGYATVYNRSYDMWDFFGPYTEKVDANAGTRTLNSNPDVVFLVNHKGLTLARTTAGTLELSNDAVGLYHEAYLNPMRSEVTDLRMAMDDRLVTEMSFAFMIELGEWNDDFTEFTIMQYDINRGDVSAVNYGANPYTSIASRQRELLRELRMAPVSLALAARDEISARTDVRILAGEDPHVGPALEASGVQVGNDAQADETRDLLDWLQSHTGHRRDATVIVVETDDDDEGEVDDVPCPACGALNADDALYCDQCGASMGTGNSVSAAKAQLALMERIAAKRKLA